MLHPSAVPESEALPKKKVVVDFVLIGAIDIESRY
jgi:hypothetical protein